MQAYNILDFIECIYAAFYATIYTIAVVAALNIRNKEISPIIIILLLLGLALIPAGLSKFSIYVDNSIDINKYNYNSISIANGLPENYMNINECIYNVNRNIPYSYYIEYPKTNKYFNTRIIIGRDVLNLVNEGIANENKIK